MDWKKALEPTPQKIKIFFVVFFIGQAISMFTLERIVDWTDYHFGFWQAITDWTFLVNFIFEPLNGITYIFHTYQWFDAIGRSVFVSIVATLNLLWLYVVSCFIGSIKK